MRGFHLFSALIGISMIAIAYGLIYMMNSNEDAYATMITKKIYAYSALRISDMVREDSYALLVKDVRRDFQDFFEKWGIDPPQECWEDPDKFKNWFENTFARSEKVVKWLAERLAYYLRGYQGRKVGTYYIDVKVNEESLENVLKETLSFKKMGDGTFAVIIDMSDVTDDVYKSLPKVRVCKDFECFDTVVFPRGKLSLYVPLRVFKGYEKAREVWQRVKENIDGYKLMYGFCDESYGGCGLFKWELKEPKLIFPTKSGTIFEKNGIKLIPGETEPYFLDNFFTGGCLDLYIIKNGEDYITCNNSNEMAEFLYETLNQRLANEVKNESDIEVDLLEDTISVYKVAPVYTQVALNLIDYLADQFMLPLILEAIGGYKLDTDSILGIKAIIPLSECKFRGYVYCAVPNRLEYTVTWTDQDERYSTKEGLASFKFYQKFDLGIKNYYNTLQFLAENKRLPVGGYISRNINENRSATVMCTGMYIYLKSKCDKIDLKEPKDACTNDKLNTDPFVQLYCRKDYDEIIKRFDELIRSVKSKYHSCPAEKRKEVERLYKMFETGGDCSSAEKAKSAYTGFSKIYPKCPEAKGVMYSYYWHHIGATIKSTCSGGSVVP